MCFVPIHAKIWCAIFCCVGVFCKIVMFHSCSTARPVMLSKMVPSIFRLRTDLEPVWDSVREGKNP